jgi:hypothetical protein
VHRVSTKHKPQPRRVERFKFGNTHPPDQSSYFRNSRLGCKETQAQIAEANARFDYEADLAALRFQSGSQP